MKNFAVIFILFSTTVILAFLTGRKRDSENFFPFGNNFPDTNRQHPVLAYQREASYDTYPASWGDPIRPPPTQIGPTRSSFDTSFKKAYDLDTGPYPGKMLNIPVPAGSLKESSEKWDYPFYYQQKPLPPYDYFRPYGPNLDSMQKGLVYADTPFYKKPMYGNPALDYTGSASIPFISSVNSFAPFPEVVTPWEKSGMIQNKENNGTIMNLYRRPIAPLQDLYEYMVQDKNGFVIPLKNIPFLQDGDIIPYVQGYETLGPWKVNIYYGSKWVWS